MNTDLQQLMEEIRHLPTVSAESFQPPPNARGEAVLRLRCGDEAWSALPELLTRRGLNQVELPDCGLLVVAADGSVGVITRVVTDTLDHPTLDLPGEAALFWLSLLRTAGALSDGRTFAAHGHLEGARLRLVTLYRLAQSGSSPVNGWDDLDESTGAQPLLALRAWLVAPLDSFRQWRCAHQLAEAYEGLVLPLFERLRLPYPWVLRNLAFRRLDEVRPASPGAPAGAGESASAPTAEPPVVKGSAPLRLRGKLRRPGNE